MDRAPEALDWRSVPEGEFAQAVNEWLEARGLQVHRKMVRHEGPTITTARAYAPMVSSDHLISYDQLYKTGVRHEVKTKKTLVYHARNQAVRIFLNAVPRDDYLVFFDDDMLFPADTLQKLVSHGLPVVGGLYFMKDVPFEPVMFRYKSRLLVPSALYGETGFYNIVATWEPNSLIEVDGIGCGCMAIQRKVLEILEYPWFNHAEGTEDLFFCRKVQQAGFKIHMDTSVICGHCTSMAISIDNYMAWRAARDKGAKEPLKEATSFMAFRDYIADAQVEPPRAQMHYVERRWTTDTTPGPEEESPLPKEYPY